jgi:hypothetical protein
MKNKRGSHVGIVLSFVVFITFLIFMYTAIQPAVEVERGKQNLLDYLEKELINQFSSNLTTVTIKFEDSFYTQKDCITIPTIEEVGDFEDLIVKDSEGSFISSFPIGGEIHIFHDPQEIFYKLYFSSSSQAYEAPSDQSPPSIDCENLESENYTVAQINPSIQLFESRIENFILNLSENSAYEDYLDSVSFPTGSDFGLNFLKEGGEIIGTPERQINTNIYVKDVQIQYVNQNAEILPGTLKIRVW